MQDRDEHADRADGAHQAEERDAGEVEREQRDEHGRAGEDDGVARGAVGQADRLVHRHALLELRAVPVQDEERVVDADRQAQHHPQHRRDRDELDEARERQRCEHADADAEQGASTSGSAAPISVPSMTNSTIAAMITPPISPGPRIAGTPWAMSFDTSTSTPSMLGVVRLVRDRGLRGRRAPRRSTS